MPSDARKSINANVFTNPFKVFFFPMNSTTKYQKLRHFFFVIDFCFGPRQIAGFVAKRAAVRDVTTFRAADSHSVSGDE